MFHCRVASRLRRTGTRGPRALILIMADNKHAAPVSRRTFFESLAILAGGIAALGVSATPAAAKMPQKASGYQTKPKNGQNCASCEHFEPPASCGLVASPISPNGWCHFYLKK